MNTSKNTSKNFRFEIDPYGFFVRVIFVGILTVITLGLATPYAMIVMQRWQVKHTLIDGRRLKFNGKFTDLIVNYLKWYFLTIITLGVYYFWMVPYLNQWMVENTDFEDVSIPESV